MECRVSSWSVAFSKVRSAVSVLLIVHDPLERVRNTVQ